MAFNERYNSIDNTNPLEQALNNEEVKVPTSSLPYGRSHVGNMNIGTLEILDCFDCMPNGKYTINMDLLIKTRLPLNRRIMNGLRVYVKGFYMSYDDLWEAGQNHIDHGRSGLLDINKPYFDGYLYNSDSATWDTFTPNSPANQLGVPVRNTLNFGAETGNNSDNIPLNAFCPVKLNHANLLTVQDFVVKINALPLVMYQRIWIDRFAPKNLIQQNKNYLPDNISKQRLSYSLTEVNSLTSSGGSINKSIPNTSLFDNPNSIYYTGSSSVSDYIFLKRFVQKKGDYFDTASPFADLIRGSVPSVSLTQVVASLNPEDISIFEDLSGHEVPALKNIQARLTNDTESALIGTEGNGETLNSNLNDLIRSELAKAKITGNVQAAFTANTLRTLLTATLIKERAARTNGDYKEYVKAMFGKYPKTNDFQPTYIGGFYQDIVFSDVTQTSESSDSSPLGTQAGQAMSANRGNIGTFYAPDFGYIMLLAYIVPDDFYNQGMPRMLGDLSADDVYLPPNNNLPPQAIKKQEIFLTNSEETNNDVWAYTERYEHLKARDNYVSGLCGLPKQYFAEDASIVMHKRLADVPSFDSHFVLLTPDNVDMDVFTVTDEPPFFFEAISDVTKIEPIPYDTTPSDMGLKYV